MRASGRGRSSQPTISSQCRLNCRRICILLDKEHEKRPFRCPLRIWPKRRRVLTASECLRIAAVLSFRTAELKLSHWLETHGACGAEGVDAQETISFRSPTAPRLQTCTWSRRSQNRHRAIVTQICIDPRVWGECQAKRPRRLAQFPRLLTRKCTGKIVGRPFVGA